MLMTKQIEPILVTILRNLIIASVGFFILIFVDYIMDGSYFNAFLANPTPYISIVFGYVFASEGTLFAERWFNRNFKHKWPSLRLNLIKIAVIVAFYALIFTGYFQVFSEDIEVGATILTSVLSVVYVLMLDLVVILKYFYNDLELERKENARLREEKLKSDLKALQNQLNPHFLFNSLNGLISEIYHDPEQAVKYTEKLSDVYRYVLQSSKMHLVTLAEELKFIDSYLFIYKKKHGDAIKVHMDVPEKFMDNELPPMVLQILLENCIKHNIIDVARPLEIDVLIENESLIVVRNTKHPKKDTFSTSTGLSNIRSRYEILQNTGIEIVETDAYFTVKLPLIQ
jgi:two-component system, LytTR family, sensor kinase